MAKKKEPDWDSLNRQIAPSSEEGWVKDDAQDELGGGELFTKSVKQEVTHDIMGHDLKRKLDQLRFQPGDVTSLMNPRKDLMDRELYNQLVVFAHHTNLTLIRSRCKDKGREVYQVALVEVHSDGSWEPVEVAQHPDGLTTAGLILARQIYDRFGGSGGN